MQLGTRWLIGTEPPAGLPEAIREAIRAVEAADPADGGRAPDDRRRWTLTWLERRPRVELDDGPLLTLDAAGAVMIDDPDDD